MGATHSSNSSLRMMEKEDHKYALELQREEIIKYRRRQLTEMSGSGNPVTVNPFMQVVLVEDGHTVAMPIAPRKSAHGAHKHDINCLPTHKWTKPKQEDVACCICLCEYEPNEVVRTLPCLHMFHKKCIDTWLQKNAICPECRRPALQTA